MKIKRNLKTKENRAFWKFVDDLIKYHAPSLITFDAYSDMHNDLHASLLEESDKPS